MQIACAPRVAFATRPARRQQAPRRQQRLAVHAAASDELLTPPADPEDARGAIAVGLKFSNAGNWAQAQVGGHALLVPAYGHLCCRQTGQNAGSMEGEGRPEGLPGARFSAR